MQEQMWTSRSMKLNFPKFVIDGDIEKIKRAVRDEKLCDVNMDIYYNENIERPLTIAIKSIREQNDNFFRISEKLLQSLNINVNEGIFYDQTTILEYLCETEQNTTFGIELLLKGSRTIVNKTNYKTLP